MRAAEQVALARHLQTLIETQTTDSAPAAARLPVALWSDPDRHARERSALFERAPRPVAFASELRQPGDFVTTQLGRLPLIVVRGEDGRIRALVNICRHRGARLIAAPRGQAERLICPFHAWCFRLDGSLDRIPGSDTFGSIDRAERGLLDRPAAVRHGLVWVQPLPGMALDVAGWLGPALDDELSAYELDDFTLRHEQRFEVAANWKLVMDGFLETYHIRALHRHSIAPHFYSNLSAVKPMGRHLRLAIPKRRIERMYAEPPTRWQVLAHLTVAYALLPGGVIMWQSGHFEIFLVEPDHLDPGRCTVRLGMLVPSARAADTALWARNWQRVTETISREDFAQAEAVQRGFESGAQADVLIGRNELGMHLFYAEVGRAVDAQAPL